MKKFVFLVTAMMLVSAVSGQRPTIDTLECPDSMYNQQYVYYKFIYDWCQYIVDWDQDTIQWGANTEYTFLPNFAYKPRTDPDGSLTPDNRRGFYAEGNGILGPQFITYRPLKIVGIGAPAYMEAARDTSFYDNTALVSPSLRFLNTRDTTLAGRITDSMILYKVVGDSLVELMSKGWRMDDPHRYIHLPPAKLGGIYYPNGEYDTSVVVPLYEVIFDKPVVVEDSFVVAGTYFNNEGSYAWQVEPGTEQRKRMWLWDHNPTRYIRLFGYSDHLDLRREFWCKYRTLDWMKGRCWSWRAGESIYPFELPMIFPIIDPDFDTVMCHEVRNLRVAEHGAGRATLMWDSGDGGPWIVAHGKMEDDWDDYIFDTVTSPTVTLTGLDVGTVYFALVRGYCSVTGEYGEWSSPLEVEVYQQGHEEPEGIEQAGELGRFIRLMPNPARDVVSVVSSYRMRRVALYDLSGRMVVEQEADGITATVDVSGLASGTYIAAIYLPHGVVTKKLVVEKGKR